MHRVAQCHGYYKVRKLAGWGNLFTVLPNTKFYRKICSTNIELSVKTRINFFLSVLHTTRKKCALFPKRILAFRRKTNSEEWEWKSILEHDGTKLSQVFSLFVFIFVFVLFILVSSLSWSHGVQ